MQGTVTERVLVLLVLLLVAVVLLLVAVAAVAVAAAAAVVVTAVAATVMGPRMVGTVALANASPPKCGMTVNVDQAGAVCCTPMTPLTMPVRAPVPQG